MRAAGPVPGRAGGPAKLRLEGTHRAVPPEETLAWVAPMLASMGISRVADVTGLDRIGIPVWTACRPNSRSLSVSQGKGLTDAAARASAVMEAIELHHAERPLVPLLLASEVEMADARRPIVDITSLASTTTSRYHRERPMLWTEAVVLGAGDTQWVPFEVVHTSALLPGPTGGGCFSSTSNGLASGNHLLEATVHAICEVIERDAAAVWQATPKEARAATLIDAATVPGDACRKVLRHYQDAGITVAVWETTSDVGVPSFLCEIADASLGPEPQRHTGMGCHLDAEVALLRAMTEAAQSRLTYITGSRDDLSRREYRRVRAGGGAGPDGENGRAFASGPAKLETPSFAEDVEVLCDRLRRAGTGPVLLVDLTSKRFGVPVVRVIVPGMEGPDDEPTYVRGRRAIAAASA